MHQFDGQMDVFEVLEDVERNGLVPGECIYCRHADGLNRSLSTWCNCHCHNMHERARIDGGIAVDCNDRIFRLGKVRARPLWNRPSSPASSVPIPPLHSRTYTGGHRANHSNDHGDGGTTGSTSNG